MRWIKECYGLLIICLAQQSSSLSFDTSKSANRIASEIEYLASPLLEGRAPGTRGEALAAQYIATTQLSLGLTPFDDSDPFAPQAFIQSVPLRGTTVNEGSVSDLLFSSNQINFTLKFKDNEVHTSDLDLSSVSLSSLNTYFVGYGIVAPELNWDDYKGLNVSGGCVVSLAGQPDAFQAQSEKEQSLTYYARWTYKYEEARRQGAACALIIHTDEKAGYIWDVVVSSNSGEQVRSDEPLINGVSLRGWIRSDIADSLAKASGASSGLSTWFADSELTTFKALLLPFKVSQSTSYQTRLFSGSNVIGVYPPSNNAKCLSGPAPIQCESVVIMGHLDHLGIRDNQTYTGALDNGSGAALTHELVRLLDSKYNNSTFIRERALIVLNPTGEESGLIGSSYFSHHSPSKYPSTKVVAAITFDIANAWGITSDLVVLGAAKSTLGEIFQKSAISTGMSDGLSPDPVINQGMFFRSDHFSYANINVPSVWVSTGTKFVGQSPSYYNDTVQNGYFKNQYHRPSDTYSSNIKYDGMIQQVLVTLDVVSQLLFGTQTPTCYSGCK